MILKSLEIKGFKSFGDKVQIHFDQGVTGIVGPNGCGKSNVVDSIRWVLGEQKTRALRSDKMENVIFNGTKSRKAAHLSEVSLQFENNRGLLPTEYNEVKITRKLYRTGESEYQINGVLCRLKDIHSLFLDTGIGSDSYAIMELGMIDDILNDKENSRRLLFEEASGVSKYKIRKKETLNKLKGTDEDLSRVEDLLFEIDKNRKQLQAQAKKTERYYQLRNEYKKWALELAAQQLNQFTTEIDSLESQCQSTLDQKGKIESLTQVEDAQIAKIKLTIVDFEKLLQSRQKATHEKLDEIRKYENEKNLQNQKLSMLGEQESSFQLKLEEDKIFLEKVAQELQILSEQWKQEKEQVHQANLLSSEAQVRWKEAETQLASVRSMLTDYQLKLQNITSEKHQIEKSLAIHKIQFESMNQELERNMKESEEKIQEISGFDVELNSIELSLKKAQSDVEQHIKEEEALQLHIDFLQKQHDAAQLEKQSTERIIDAKRNEYQLTKSLVDNLEGYPESLKFLKKNAEWAQNAQLLSDLITCEPDIKTSIENYLEPYLNYYVVETMEEAFQGVTLLSNSSKGRANFFVIEYFHHHEQHKPIIAPQTMSALQMVNVDAKYNHLINYLLGNVYILQAENDQQESILAANYRKKYPQSVFLSATGKYVITGQSIGGGSIGLFEGKRLGRKRNLEILLKEITDLEQKIIDFDAFIQQSSNEISVQKSLSKKSSIEEGKLFIQQLKGQLQLVQSKHQQHAQFIANHQNRKEAIQQKIEESARLINEQTPQLHSLETQAADWQRHVSELQENISKAIEANQLASKNYNETNTSALQLQNKLSVLERDFNFNENQQQVLRQRMEKNAAALEITKKELSELIQKPELNDANLVEMYREKEAMDAAVQEVEQSVAEAKSSLFSIEEQMKEYRNQKDSVTTRYNKLKDQINGINLKKLGLVERLSVEFNIATEELEDLKPTVVAEIKSLQEKVTNHKQKLDHFGEINPLALEAYDEISQRFDFIESQKNDLLDSKKILVDTLKEIDKTAKEKFQFAFESIRANFQKVFRTLFTEEDTCDLVLMNANDPLDAPINIIARPKGKKPLTINQLSGGEKTLTAIALLFAIYLYKPAPFCIFDEVDAPLDDVNIDKFNKIIRQFSEQSQFIIVTHNKRTMETTDVMYGITMVEQGVSRVVPVDLRSQKN